MSNVLNTLAKEVGKGLIDGFSDFLNVLPFVLFAIILIVSI